MSCLVALNRQSVRVLKQFMLPEYLPLFCDKGQNKTRTEQVVHLKAYFKRISLESGLEYLLCEISSTLFLIWIPS